MLRRLLLVSGCLSFALAPSSCAGGDAGSDAGTAAGDAAGETGGPPDPEPEPAPPAEPDVPPDVPADVPPDLPIVPFECSAYQPACVGDASWTNCNDTGDGHGKVYDCDPGLVCDPCSGTCLAPLCDPGETRCADTNRYQTCNETGTCWLPDLVACDAGLYCYQGACQKCVPGQAACVDTATAAVCDPAGKELIDATPCEAELGCNEYSGKCLGKVCAEGEILCASLTAFQPCLPSGTGFDLDLGSCPKSEPACYQGECIPAECLPAALFLIDRSGSMTDKWDSVKEGVEAVILGNPEAAFGLLAFPVATSCGTKSYPDLPLGFWTKADLDVWFETFRPGGSTPLTAAMIDVEANPDIVFGVGGGTMIVVSDGQDTCYKDGDIETKLASVTVALRDEHNVKTYVVGYNYQGPSSQLNAIAENGGTDYETFFPAGTEAELVTAVSGIVSEVAECLQE